MYVYMHINNYTYVRVYIWLCILWFMKQLVILFSVESLPGRLATGISNLKNGGDMMYEHDSQPINTTKVSSPGTYM